MEQHSIKKDIAQINGWKSESNEQQLKIFNLLYMVDEEEIWKQRAYYKGTPKLQKYAMMSFKDLLNDIFKVSHQVYIRMRDSLMKIDNWRELYRTHGWNKNMGCFINRNEPERNAILKAIGNGDTRDISTIWRSIYPKAKDKPTSINNGWKVKYEKAVRENKS